MKKAFLFLIGIVVFIHLSKAQDVIFMYDGTKIEAKVINIDSGIIEFKMWNNQEGPSYSIQKKDVVMINYANGNRDMFTVQSDTLPATRPLNSNEELAFDSESLSYLRLGNKPLSEQEAIQLLTFNNQNIYDETWVGACRQKIIGNSLFIPGLIVWVSSDIIYTVNYIFIGSNFINDLSSAGNIVGFGLFSTGLILKIIGNARMSWVLDTYNNDIRLKGKTSLSIMPTPTGIGLQLKF